MFIYNHCNNTYKTLNGCDQTAIEVLLLERSEMECSGKQSSGTIMPLHLQSGWEPEAAIQMTTA